MAKQESGDGARIGLLVVDHGSRRETSNRQLETVAERLRALRPDALVAHAHMELASPTIAEGFEALAGGGATSVYVLPFFLGEGRHALEDVPRMVAEAAEAHPTVSWHMGRVLGTHDRVAELLLEQAALAVGPPGP